MGDGQCTGGEEAPAPGGEAVRELDALGAFVHGALAFGHALGLVYNARRGNKVDVAVHGAALLYDLWAARKHYLDSLPKKNYQLEAERMCAKGVNGYANRVRTAAR